MPTHESQKDKRKSNRYSEETPLYPGQSLMPPTFAPKAGEALPSKDWQPDQGGNLYYKTETEAQNRLKQLKGKDGRKAYRVKSFDRNETTYWRVEIGALGRKEEKKVESFWPEIEPALQDNTTTQIPRQFLPDEKPIGPENPNFVGPIKPDAANKSSSPKATPGKKPNSKKSLETDGDWIIGPILDAKDYISQAPVGLGEDTPRLTNDELFQNELAKYGPGGKMDISVKENRESRWYKGITYEQALEQVYWIGCHNTTRQMVENAGFNRVEKDRVTILKENVKAKTTAATDDFQKGLDLLDRELSKGKPLIAGVHRGGFSATNADASDHFVVIVGKVQKDDKIGYVYFDPGTSKHRGHDGEENIMWIEKGNKVVDDHDYRNSRIELTRITSRKD